MNLFKPVYLLSLALVFVGITMSVKHLPGRNLLILISLLLTLVYIILALYEIYGSNRINMSEKIMWTVGFILFNALTGLLYLLIGQPRILREYKILHH